ncbi:MAG: FAD-dependent oxidoreductase, partial [Lachnospiraceae bacterium]|nr:FAD-dependent oxidoreductase [Lachnospiraceae bacterium]
MMKSIKNGLFFVVVALFCVSSLVGCENHNQVSIQKVDTQVEPKTTGVAKGVGRNINTDIEVELNIENNILKDISFKDNIETYKKAKLDDLLGFIKSMLVGKDKMHIDAVSAATSTINAINYGIIDAFDKGGFDKKAFGIDDTVDKSYIVDGTYEGECLGMNDIVRVQVTLKDKKIKDVKVVYEKETPGLGGYLKDKNGKVLTYGGISPLSIIPKKILEHQTLNVDTVSGATVTSDAIKIACRRALDKAGCKEYDFSTICRSEMEAKDVDTDICIIGAGGAGMVSAISAASNGAKVLLVEKNGQVGGDTLVCGAIYNTSDEDFQKKIKTNATINKAIDAAIKEKPINEEHKKLIDTVKKEYDEHNKKDKTVLYDSPSWHALQTFVGGDKVANLSLIKKLTSKSYDSYLWLKRLGVEFMDFASQAAGALWQRSHTTKMDMGTGLISAYVEHIEKDKNIDLMLDTKCVGLLYDGDKIVGAKCITKDGKEFTIHCKSVILATGGFAANTDMIRKYNVSGKWDDLSMVKTTNRWTVSNGDGITLAENIGASLTDMEQIQLLYLSEVENGQLAKYPIRCVQAIDQIIFVNKEGKRFVNEGGRRDEICLAANRQTDGVFYIIESGDGDKYIDIHDPSWRSADGFTFDYLVDNGYIYVADTLDELADKLSIDRKVLNDTVAKFNKSVDTGVDDFKRTLYTTKLENGPFVATPRITAIHHTMGGVTIDENAHVLDKNGDILNGFY